MIRKEGYLAATLRIVVFAVIFVFFTSSAWAAALYFSPSAVNRSAGQTFAATVRVNTGGQAINAAQGSIVYDPSQVEIISVSKAGSIFNLWTQDPTFSNPDGTLSFEGGLPNPGYSGSAGLILTITFKAKSAGQISLVSGAILANDGQGTNILDTLGKLSLSVSGVDQSAPAPSDNSNSTPSTPTAGQLPSIHSSTHPDSSKWYSNNNPQFSWDLPSDATGVSFLITDKPTSNPGPKSDGLTDKTSFTGLSDGTQYLHIKYKEAGTWGPIAHFQFNIDTKAPEAFQIQTVDSSNPQPQITFQTTDSLSGIDHYEIKIDDSDWTTVASGSAGQPYTLNFKKVGTQTVSVKAVDRAGNATIEQLPITVTSVGATSSVGKWVDRIFNGLVNIISSYGLFILFLAALTGFLILLFQLLGKKLDKAWHRMQDKKVVKKSERMADTTFDHLVKDMHDEIKFLNAIAKRRRLGPEEKYLKSKLEQYAKALKGGGR